MGMFGRGGGQALNALARYDTALTPAQEQAFQAWRARLPRNLQSMDDYDLRGAFKANAQSAANGHLTDTYKKPNHPTFSSESQYSTPSDQGGNWVEGADGRWLFFATPANLRYRDGNALANYFQRYEPDSRLIPPANMLSVFRTR